MQRSGIGRYLAALVFGLVLGPGLAHGWNATGHMIIAQIAVDRLDETAKDEVDRLIAVLGDFEPKITDAVPAATWMDSLKHRDLVAFNAWHYINKPYNADGLPRVAEAAQENVVWAIGQAVDTLSSADAGDFEKALMLRVLLHIAGDAHQPLHAVTRFTTARPTGDQGGNLFHLVADDPFADDLHGFWDGTAGLFPYVDPASDWRPRITAFADEITTAFPAADLPARDVRDPAIWAEESYALAVDVAYQGIEENTRPSEAYAAKAQEVVKRRLAIGGYRLGALLQALFGAVDGE